MVLVGTPLVTPIEAVATASVVAAKRAFIVHILGDLAIAREGAKGADGTPMQLRVNIQNGYLKVE